MRRLWPSIFALLTAAPAFAGGYTLPYRGPRAMSVGGAYVAGAQGGDALWYNPAQLKETSLNVDLSVISLSANYSNGGASVENGATPLPNPSLGFVLALNKNVSLGIGAYAPFSAQYSFPEDGPQRYALVANDKTVMLITQLGIGVHFGNLHFGAGLQNVYGHLVQRMTLSGYTGLFGAPEDRDLDVLTEVELRDPFTLTGNLGASYDLGAFTFAASVQLPFTLSGESDFRVRLPSSIFFDPVTIEGSKAQLELAFPLIARLGVQYRVFPRLMLETAATFEDWSVQTDIVSDPGGRMVLRNVPGIGDYRMPPIRILRDMRDTFSVHLGGDFEVVDRLHLRAGALYETSAFGDETFSVAVLDDEKLGVGVGLSWNVGRFRIDLAGSRIFQGTRTIERSALTQINPTNPEQATVIGNGTYKTGYWAFGGGLRFVL